MVDYDLARVQVRRRQMVAITDDDIASTCLKRSRNQVLEFVPAADVDPMMFDRGATLGLIRSRQSYVLLAKTLASRRMAIVHFTLRNKTRLAALRVKFRQARGDDGARCCGQ